MARVGPRSGAWIAAPVAAAVCLSALAVPPLAAVGHDPEGAPGTGFLTGRLLIAAPDMSDPRFRESVIYMVAHDEQGAFGLIVNKVLGTESLSSLRFEGEPPIESDGRAVRIHFGGPVEFGRGFVLHTPDYVGERTVVVGRAFAMTPGEDADLVRALARGEGPRGEHPGARLCRLGAGAARIRARPGGLGDGGRRRGVRLRRGFQGQVAARLRPPRTHALRREPAGSRAASARGSGRLEPLDLDFAGPAARLPEIVGHLHAEPLQALPLYDPARMRGILHRHRVSLVNGNGSIRQTWASRIADGREQEVQEIRNFISTVVPDPDA